RLRIAKGTAAGFVSDGTTSPASPFAAGVSAAAFGRIDDDELADLVIATQDPMSGVVLSVIWGDGTLAYSGESLELLHLPSVGGLVVRDLDGDGFDDVVAADPDGASVALLHCSGTRD